MIDRYSIKADARERLRHAVPRPYVEGLLFVLVAGILTALSTALMLSQFTQSNTETYMKYVLAGRYEDAMRYLQTFDPPLADYLISNVLDVFRGIVAAGLSIFAMNTLRRKEASLGNLLDGFGRFFPLLALVILMRFLLSFWFYLLVIPGILAYYRYRLAVYLLIDHPELNCFQCLLLSGQVMRGKKWELFLLDLSFLGWALLAVLPLTVGAVFGLVGLILGALGSAAILAWLAPYYELSCVGFYEAVKTPIQSIPPTN